MILTVIGSVLLFFVLVFSLTRLKPGMDSFLDWCSQSLRGNSGEESARKKNKSKKTQKKAAKTYEEPTFSTSLTTPIEEILEESLKEDVKPETSTSRKKGKNKSQASAQRDSRRNLSDEENLEEYISHSFFKVKTPEAAKSDKILKKKTSNRIVEEELPVVDDVGFSLSAKEKGKSRKSSPREKKNSKETLNAVVEQSLKKSKEDLSKLSIIDHYKNKAPRTNIVIEAKPIVSRGETELANEHNFVIINKDDDTDLFELQNKTEFKESKKVSSSISYANVLTNKIPEEKIETQLESEIVTQQGVDIKPVNKSQKETVSEVDITTENSRQVETLKIGEENVEQYSSSEPLTAAVKATEPSGGITIPLTKPTSSGSLTDSKSSCSEAEIATEVLIQLEPAEIVEENVKKYSSLERLIANVKATELSGDITLPSIKPTSSESLTDSKSSCSEAEIATEALSQLEPSEIVEENVKKYSSLERLIANVRATELSGDITFPIIKRTPLRSSSDRKSDSSEADITTENLQQLETSEDSTVPISVTILSVSNSSSLEIISTSAHSSYVDLHSSYEEIQETNETPSPVNYIEIAKRYEELFPENLLKPVIGSLSKQLELDAGLEEHFESYRLFKEQIRNENAVVAASSKDSDFGVFEANPKRQADKEEQEATTSSFNNGQSQEDTFTKATDSADVDKLIDFIDDCHREGKFNDVTELHDSSYSFDKENPLDNTVIYSDKLHQDIISDEKLDENIHIEVDTTEFSFQETAVDTAQDEDPVDIPVVEKSQDSEEYNLSLISSNSEVSLEKDVESSLPLSNYEFSKTESLTNEFENQKFIDDLIDHVPSAADDNQQTVVDCFHNSVEDLKDTISNLIEEDQISYSILQSTPVAKETTENMETKMPSPQQIRVLTLNNQEHQECTLYRIEKNWAIQFRLGPSLFGRKVYLYCNYPTEQKGGLVEFNRSKYQLLSWVLDEGCKNADDTAAYSQVTAQLAGSFHYYFTFDAGENAERHGSGYFLVDPILEYGNNENLSLDCIQCQTVLSRCLGSFSTWERKLQVAKESGYNMIHFTPIQALGISNSCYSLREQLQLNPDFKKEDGEMPTFEEIEKFTATIRKDWKVTSICDIVLNHTANESEWIKDHPEVTYNCANCPYMRPAYLLDAAFHQFSIEVKNGLYEDRGIPIEVNHEDHLNAIRYHFRISILEPLKLQELFICNANQLVREFLNLARVTPPVTLDIRQPPSEELKLIQDPEYKRLAGTIDMKMALNLCNVYWNDTFDEESRLKRCAEELKNKLVSLNNAVIEGLNNHVNSAIENVIAGIRYFRVQSDGPRVKEMTVKNPLVYRYFTDYGTPKSLQEHEDIMYSNKGRFLMAHNGWVMNSDPLKNFAAPDSHVYIRRELIAWGDSVKLRFGDKPEDCPFLWDYMRKYVEETARIFDGVRLDNCHSTPIPVAEYLLDCARRVRPNLYVVAELFTNSDMTDNIFVNRLGITSLIREAMSAWDSHEEGRLVYRYGGYPVGSFYQPSIRPLVPSIAHALFLDLTHDNPSPVDKRSVFDLLPSTALVNMACCASGSNRGYDELVPHHIHVVDETRQYTEWTDDENLALGNLRYVTKRTGIISAKKAINDLHFTLGKEGYNQVYVDQIDPDIVAVTRHRPDTHESYILVAFTAFGHPCEDAGNYQRGIKPLRVEGTLNEIVLEATLSHVSTKNGGSPFAKWENFVKDAKWVNGLSEYHVSLKQHIQVDESNILEKGDSGTANVTQLNFKNFKPGSIVVVKVSLPEAMSNAVKTVRRLIDNFSITKETELSCIISKLSLTDLNRAIYRCDQEERDEGFGFDTYNIPNFASTVYAGLQGFMSLLANIRPNNDLGHPMCANLRDGNWMIEYIWKRLKLDEGTKELGQWIEENTKCFDNIPRYLVPSYFDVIFTGIYVLLIDQSYKLMSNFVNHGSTFVRGLSLGSLQFAAYIKSADLPMLSPNLAPPKPPTIKNEKGETVQACVTLSAGLPHFAVGYMRNWGRDTFISLRGLFILTGRYEEARQHILAYGACLRHGLIPNLLDGGRNSRFNCRDAVWWWLYCIKVYAEEAPNGLKILSDKVSRIFPTDDSPAQPPGAVDQPLHDIIQEALKIHFQGLAFRERNAGWQIDEHMTDRGFNNQIGIHPETGFVFGGNEWNCGTWMDKMGSSDRAGIRGKPATPRDGSAVELIGLSKAVITWLAKLSQEKEYPYSGVERTHKNGSVTKWSFKEWGDKIQANFEKYFWVNTTPVPGEYRADLINKRGIYKDCYGATQEWTDFQLRCNFPIAMVAAPELFTPQQAWAALNQAEKYLLGPLGMKTLDPEDWAYRGDYDNSNDSNDPYVSHGFNYHQGPEWVWPVGFFLKAKLHFAALNGALAETLASTKLVLSKHFTELQTSPWRGLPELTNSNGSYCRDSSRTQAWSMACILEVLNDLQRIESSQPIHVN